MRLMASSQPSGVERSQAEIALVVFRVAGAALGDDERIGNGDAFIGLFGRSGRCRPTAPSTLRLRGRHRDHCATEDEKCNPRYRKFVHLQAP